MGLPEIEYPTDNEGWAHCLTIPRVLNVENGQQATSISSVGKITSQ